MPSFTKSNPISFPGIQRYAYTGCALKFLHNVCADVFNGMFAYAHHTRNLHYTHFSGGKGSYTSFLPVKYGHFTFR